MSSAEERRWIFPWEVDAGTPPHDDGLLCDECLTGGPGLTTWVEYSETRDPSDPAKRTITENHVLTLHGACMTSPMITYDDELAAKRANR